MSRFIVWLFSLLAVAVLLTVLFGQSGKENLDLPYDAGSAENEDEELAPDIILFYGQLYEADAVVFCCDVSGSMIGKKWNRLQNEVLRNIQTFNERTQFAIVLFSHTIQAFPPTLRVVEATPRNRYQAHAFLTAARPGGATCTQAAIVQAIQRIEMSSQKRKVVLHHSDGMNFCPGTSASENRPRYDADILQAVQKENNLRVTVNTLAYGPAQQVNEEFMRRLADENGGRYARVVD